jgi:hypothetical protein
LATTSRRKESPSRSRRARFFGLRTIRSSGKGASICRSIRTAWSISLRAGMTTRMSTSLSECGCPWAYEPNKMIFSGPKRSATSRANRRMTAIGTSAPRYQRAWSAFFGRATFLDMPVFYTMRRPALHRFGSGKVP